MLQNQNSSPFEHYADFGILRYLSGCRENKDRESSIFANFCLKSSVSEEKFESGLNNLLYHGFVRREIKKSGAEMHNEGISFCVLTPEGKSIYSLLKKNFGKN